MKPLAFIVMLFAAGLCFTSCNNNMQATADCQKTIDSLKTVINADHSGDAAALAVADSLWSFVASTKSVEGFLSFYAPGAIQMPPNHKMNTTREDIEQSVKDLYAIPGVSISWKSTKVEVSHSGELGYVIGEYTIGSKDAKGKPATELGKFSEVWKKQADGSWKCIVDMWSPNSK